MNFKTIIGLTLIICFSFQSCKEGSVGDININQDWKFKLLEDSNGSEDNYHTEDFNDSNWTPASLPHTANLEPLVVNNQWQGICWYRKNFTVPSEDLNKKVILELEAAMNHSKIWVNGMEVTTHIGGYLPVVSDISKYIKSGNNTIAIRLNNNDNPITGPKPLKILDFNTYGGLYRNAWLKVKNKVHISHPVLADKVAGGGVFITTPKVSKKESQVQVKTHIVNDENDAQEVKIVHSIFYDKELVKEQSTEVVTIETGKDLEFVEKISIENSKLWSPKYPNLYKLETTVYVGEKVVDTNSERFGIREFTFDDDNQLYINGEKTFLRGVNRHQEYPFVGYALSDNAQYRDAKKIKEAGFNYIRLSHYPQSPAFMDACDELGLVVVDAVLGWQYYLDSDQFREQIYKSAKELIYRDRNHASVLAWEVSLNETKMPVFFMEELDKIVHEQYPGEHVYSCGWMDDVYDIYFQARQHRLLHPHELKNKPYSVSEYGDWEYYSNNAGLNQDKLSKTKRYETSSRQRREYGEARLLQQAFNLQESHNDNMNTVAYSDSYWVMYDYNRGYHPDIEFSGIMDIFRIPKFGYYFYKSQRDTDEENVLKIATYWNEDSPLDIHVFGNCDEVALYLNDELISKQKPDQNRISTNLKHPPFTFNMESFNKGTLKAVGYIKGKQVSEDFVKTPEESVSLKMWADESSVAPQSGVNDLLFVYIAAVDNNGTIDPDFSGDIQLNIDGDIKVMNVGNIKAEAGIATALIKIGNTKGLAIINSTSSHLKGNLKLDIH
ncbi:glycoside hydrolase family 2 TIM barrel-domain containing protein [Tamlana sp. 2_MG-2023]|uniref:glycoside hydrolase family 2 TIM barrel-domain containing protein n=1 Tax=unclassified Tamlana TaxID=2614803 RepID=UPI0026E19A37|nr:MULTISPECIES: glycoside hydrolase family 2 TIM barrel-domain containing protein [unclassified Tamlana]MDO6760979.1 glycoside hydrolase family 2 TIM barrel-domain containing protein [Tamlana sp. 2_MG-2023]MDO6791235.1 glycoside hydrolase family 2 TIM barrel-domain containing protein [Tamlana sp. 1_MG-2023]